VVQLGLIGIGCTKRRISAPEAPKFFEPVAP
jgi:hypothetical protein